MASVFKKARDRQRKGASWYIAYSDENGRRRMIKGCPDKAATEAMARKLESESELRRRGVIDPKADAYARHEARPMPEHLDAWHGHLIAAGHTPKHAGLNLERVRRMAALIGGAPLVEAAPPRRTTRDARERIAARLADRLATLRLSDMTRDKAQAGLATLREAGLSLQSLNHHRAALRTFSRWAWKDGRTRDDALIALSGYNAREDRRHDRRTLLVEELRRLIDSAHRGSTYRRMSGPARALCYRLAIATGLRFSELASITPGSFDLSPETPTVTVVAAYTKNGEAATLPLPDDLADDLAPYLAGFAPGTPVFPLPDKGAAMLRVDLEAAGIAYRDASDLVFDFHALRCQCATLADAAGISPRVVQRLMRHSTLELTGRYTRPRAIDLEQAARSLPSIRPEPPTNESARATGTDGRILAAHGQRAGDGTGRNGSDAVGTPQESSSEAEQRKNNPGADLVASGRVMSESDRIHPTGFEPVTFGSVDRCSIQLSYGCVAIAFGAETGIISAARRGWKTMGAKSRRSRSVAGDRHSRPRDVSRGTNLGDIGGDGDRIGGGGGPGLAR